MAYRISNLISRLKQASPARLAILALFLLIILWLGVKTWRIAGAARSLLDSQQEGETLLADGFTQVDPEKAEALVMGVRQDVDTLKRETAVFMPLTPYLGWLPKVGSTVVVAPQLMEMADAGTEAAVTGFQGMKPALILLQGESDPSTSRIAQLVGVIGDAQEELAQAETAVDRLVTARQELGDTSQLPWRLRTLLDQADEWLPIGQDGLKLAQVLPEIMGSQGPRRYLILAQNEDELRPSGGFISGAGVLVVDQGRIVELSFQDAYRVDNFREKPYDFPPQPLYEFMGSELFLFRDANFWPDFPYSAVTAMELYSYGLDLPPLDGAIAVDQTFMKLLLEATGPIAVESAVASRITSDTVIDSFRDAWAFQGDPESAEWAEWYLNRKAFIGNFANAVRNKIEGDFASIDPLSLVQNFFEASQSKHLQIYVREPEVAAVLDEVDWDGRLQAMPGEDFLMMVDTNVGFNKSNVYIQRDFSYQVDLSQEVPVSELTINFTHTGKDDGQPCVQDISYDLTVVNDYLNLANRCYWNYLRVYTPEGSRLIQSSDHDVPGESLLFGKPGQQTAATVAELPGFTTFDNFLLVPRGQQVESHFTYQLPLALAQATDGRLGYQLTILKQAGTPAESMRISITLPQGTRLLNATPPPTSKNEGTIFFELTLEKDTHIILNYDSN